MNKQFRIRYYGNQLKHSLQKNTQLISLQPARITPNQIETIRRIINRELNKQGKIIWKINCDNSLTKKSLGVPLGGGKGKISSYYGIVKVGQPIVEIIHSDKALVVQALEKIKIKLPVDTQICQY